MSSPNLLATIRQELPATTGVAYLNTGSNGPLTRRAIGALMAEAERQLLEGRSDFKRFMEVYPALRNELRARFARLLNGGDDEIALTHHTTEGMNVAVWGLNWQAGDEIVTTSLEHEGGLLPAYVAAQRLGLTLRVVDLGIGDGDVVGMIGAVLSPRTRLVVLSHVSFISGAVLPLAEIADVVHRHGALVAVDGAQSAGAIPVDVQALGVDFYAVPGQKWLCGPEGTGALYVRRERLSQLSPTFAGFFTIRDVDAMDLSGYFLPAPGARRYEVGTTFWPALMAMRETLAWLEEEIGYEWIFAQTQAITGQAREMLADLPGIDFHSPHKHAGLTTFSLTGVQAQLAAQRLAEGGVIVRSIPHTNWLRISTGFFNNEEDLARLRQALLQLLAPVG